MNFEFSFINEAMISSRQIALKYFKSDKENKDFETKSDDSPVTKADLEINQHLIEAIKKYLPDASIISEENSFEDNIDAILQDKVFIIDPLDGTSAFIKGSSEFTVNVALKVKENLVFGAIYLPIEDVLYCTENQKLFKIEDASKSEAKIIQITAKEQQDKNKIIVIATRREDELGEIRDSLKNVKAHLEFISFSSSAKFCYLAEGKADVYYRAAKIKLWDVAAGFAISLAAGLEILDHQGCDLLERILNNSYVKNLQENQFRIESFIIKNPSVDLS